MISIVIPVFNVASYLNECIQSVVNQTYADWECILVDDGSCDGSELLCDYWANKDSRIRVIHQKNKGVSAARNKGMEVAEGEYLTLIDSDDWVDSGYLLQLYSSLLNENTDLVVGHLLSHFFNGKVVSDCTYGDNSFPLDFRHITEFVAVNKCHMLYGPCVKLYRMSIIRNYHLLFPENLSYGEDLVFNYSYLDYVRSISTTSRAVYHYRRFAGGTLSTISRPDQFSIEYKQWRILRSFYERRGMWLQESKELLFQRLWGIIYNGIFFSFPSSGSSYSYIKDILAIPEISELKLFKDSFQCSLWIKKAILYRCAICFFIYSICFIRK